MPARKRTLEEPVKAVVVPAKAAVVPAKAAFVPAKAAVLDDKHRLNFWRNSDSY